MKPGETPRKGEAFHHTTVPFTNRLCGMLRPTVEAVRTAT